MTEIKMQEYIKKLMTLEIEETNIHIRRTNVLAEMLNRLTQDTATLFDENEMQPVDIEPMPEDDEPQAERSECANAQETIELLKPRVTFHHIAKGEVDIVKVRSALGDRFTNKQIRRACEELGIVCAKYSHTFYIHKMHIESIRKHLNN